MPKPILYSLLIILAITLYYSDKSCELILQNCLSVNDYYLQGIKRTSVVKKVSKDKYHVLSKNAQQNANKRVSGHK